MFDYDLNDFAPGGPEHSAGIVFVVAQPKRALYLASHGVKERATWRA